MVHLPWEVVTRLKLEPVGCISPAVFGLHYEGYEFHEWWRRNEEGEMDYDRYPPTALYRLVDRDRLTLTRDCLGPMVYEPRTERTLPWYSALCAIHRGVTE